MGLSAAQRQAQRWETKLGNKPNHHQPKLLQAANRHTPDYQRSGEPERNPRHLSEIRRDRELLNCLPQAPPPLPPHLLPPPLMYTQTVANAQTKTHTIRINTHQPCHVPSMHILRMIHRKTHINALPPLSLLLLQPSPPPNIRVRTGYISAR